MSKIEWTDRTWNPVTGCTKVSPGCDHCYAETMAKRLAGRFGYPHAAPFSVTLRPERLAQPLGWRKPQRVFICSMGDLFHAAVPDSFIDRVMAVIAMTPHITYQVLTKRTRRMRRYFGDPAAVGRVLELMCKISSKSGGFVDVYHSDDGHTGLCLKNAWLGTSVESQDQDYRIAELLKTPAAVRFLSCEPLLASLELGKWLNGWCEHCGSDAGAHPGTDHNQCLSCGRAMSRFPTERRADYDVNALHWAIVGGESGPGARALHPDWARSIRDECQAAGVAFFMKQMTKRAPIPDDLMIREFPDTPRIATGGHWR